MPMKVRDVMTAPAVTVGPDALFAELVDLLLARDISGLPVVDDAGRLLGVVTEADLVSKEAYGRRRRRALGLMSDYLRGRDPQWVRKGAGRSARELMTADPASAAPDDDLAAAARRMLEANHKRLPVVEEGRVVGIITRHDLLEPFHRGDDAILADARRLLADPLWVPETHAADPSVASGVVTLQGTVLWPRDVVLVEAVVARIPGVVGVDNRLRSREPEPRLDEKPTLGRL
jgi:CBS domain-containing protein